MEDDDATAGCGDIEGAGDPFRGLRAQLLNLALDMLHVRFAHPLKADVFHHFHEADQAGIEQRRQSLDFGIDKAIEVSTVHCMDAI